MFRKLDRHWWGLGAAMLVGIVLGLLIHAYREQIDQARVRAIEPQLADEDLFVRLEAAKQLLRLDRTRLDAQYVGARAALELKLDDQRVAARRTLDELLDNSDFDQTLEARLLLANSYLDEASEAVAGAIPASSERVRRQVEEVLLVRSEQQYAMLQSRGLNQVELAFLQIRAADVRASMQRILLQFKEMKLAQPGLFDLDREEQSLEVEISRLRISVRDLDEQIARLCKQAQNLAPDDPRRHLALFRMYTRQGDLRQMREVARQAVALAHLDREIAGEMAGALLELEQTHATPTTPQDVALARELLGHTCLYGATHLREQLARATLALAEGKPEAAHAIGSELLKRYHGHPRAMLLLTLALLDEGRGDEALTMLAPYNDQVRTADGRLAMGLAMLAQANRIQGREYLYQCLELEPDNFRARLAVIRSYLDEGRIQEAASDVATAMRMTPDHPTVREYHVRLTVSLGNRTALFRLMDDQIAATEHGVTSTDAGAVLALLMDDAPMIDGYLSRYSDDPGHAIRLMVMAARDVSPEPRVDVTALLVHFVSDHLEPDPLQLPQAILSVTWRQLDGDASQGTTEEHDPLAGGRFIPWLHERGYQLAASAASRWPDDPAMHDLAARCAIMCGDESAARRHAADHLAATSTPSPTMVALESGLENPQSDVSDDAFDETIRRILRLRHAMVNSDDGATLGAIEALIARQPWAEPSLAMLVREGLDNGDPAAAERWLLVAERLSPRMAKLMRARYLLATGKATPAIQLTDEMTRTEPQQAYLREQAADIQAGASLSLRQTEAAVGALDHIAMTAPYRAMAIRLNIADMHMQSGRLTPAAVSVGSMLNGYDMTASQLDQALARAEMVLEPQQLESAIRGQLRQRRGDVLLTVYQARLHMRHGELDLAEALLATLDEQVAAQPRLLATRAMLALCLGDVATARSLCERFSTTPDETMQQLQAAYASWDVQRTYGPAEEEALP